MDPLTAFSLAAGILQVVDLSSKAVKKCHELYKDGSLAEHRETAEVADALAKATGTLNVSIEKSNQPRSRDDQEILDLSIKCFATAQDLVVRLNKLKADQGSRLQALTKGVKAMRQKQMLKDKQAALNEYQKVLDTRILMRLDATSLMSSRGIDTLTKEVRDLAIAIDNGQRTVERLLSDEIKDHFDRRLDGYVHSIQDSSLQQRLNESLFFPEILARQEQIPDEFRGTYQWIFEKHMGDSQSWSDLPDWLENQRGAYWISGRPGSGKSTLIKFIMNDSRTTDHLSKWGQQTKLVEVSFFFWSTGTGLQKSAAGLLRSLLYQISMQCPDALYMVYNRDRLAELDLRRDWTDQRLLSTLKLFMERKTAVTSICAFIDGLDEFVGDEDLLLEVIRLFMKTPNSKVCVASRPENTFLEEFRSCPQLRVHKLNHQDIAHTAEQKLGPIFQRSYPDQVNLLDKFVRKLAEKAQGVFLWLDLMVKDLIKGAKNGDDSDELDERLERTPDSINGMYAYKMRSLDPLYYEEAFKYFSVLIAAGDLGIQITLLGLASAQEEAWSHVQQLKIDFFRETGFQISCRRLETRILSRCAGLVDIEEEHELYQGSGISGQDRPLSFIHKSVIDYLMQEYRDSFLKASSKLLEATVVVAQALLGVIFVRARHYSSELRDESDSAYGEPLDMGPVMRIISTVSDNLQNQQALDHLQIELTGTAFQILQHILDIHHITEETIELLDEEPLLNKAIKEHLVAADATYYNRFTLVEVQSPTSFPRKVWRLNSFQSEQLRAAFHYRSGTYFIYSGPDETCSRAPFPSATEKFLRTLSDEDTLGEEIINQIPRDLSLQKPWLSELALKMDDSLVTSIQGQSIQCIAYD
ncbi:MAG: hypothetical protein Q9220_005039 [cf. Caloplaca sp. 1 TL-2023]